MATNYKKAFSPPLRILLRSPSSCGFLNPPHPRSNQRKLMKARKKETKDASPSLNRLKPLLLLSPLPGPFRLVPRFPLRGLAGRILFVLGHRWA